MISELEQTAKLVLNNEVSDVNIHKTKMILYRIIKKLFDIFWALIGLVFFIQITLFIKIIRLWKMLIVPLIGKNGKTFKFYKYRSMIPNADQELKRILKKDKNLAKEYRLNRKLENDPRITKVGKIIRKTSLDEIPQIINILKGDMSVIGNRPYLPREKRAMGKYYDDIVKTKPGLTGFWQSSLRSRGTFEERLKMEKYYSNHYGLRFDISIFFKTIKTVIGCKDAK